MMTLTDDPETFEDAIDVIRGGNMMISLGAKLIRHGTEIADFVQNGVGLTKLIKSIKYKPVTVSNPGGIEGLIATIKKLSISIDDDSIQLVNPSLELNHADSNSA